MFLLRFHVSYEEQEDRPHMSSLLVSFSSMILKIFWAQNKRVYAPCVLYIYLK